jgi:tRNA threonylcarbamoyl adenosine modification protein (Sua5/YciO/YrdC/YwlC family)
MKTIRIWNDTPSDRQLAEICDMLEQGAIMIYPTDTLYALGCDALNTKAIERICRLKGINPEKTNLSVVCDSISRAAEYARIDNTGFRVMRDNTPGPFTFLFKAASSLPRAFKGRKTVGIRIPECKTDLMIVSTLGKPLLTTSIEAPDEDYTVNPELIAEIYEGRVDFMVDSGEGLTEPSTIVDCTGSTPEIIRQGKGILQ